MGSDYGAGMSGSSSEPPTNPAGGFPPPPPPSGQPPAGPPPAGPPPAGPPPVGQPRWPLPQPPTAPAHQPPQWPPTRPPGPPPSWPPTSGPPGPPFGPRPPRKRRWPLFLALGLVLVLVAGLGVTGWLYATGRFGIGPLSAADKDAATTIAAAVGAPEWAEEDQIECAVDELVEESRSDALEQRGLIERDGDDWAYTEEWETADATSYFASVLDCSDDWPDQVGEMWALDDTGCLDDVGADTMASYFAAELLTLADADSDDSAEQGRREAIEQLDGCYVTDPPAPSADAESAYRAVRFTFDEPDPAAGDVVLNVKKDGDWQRLRRTTFTVGTEAGGRKGCVSAQTVAKYAWGTTSTAEQRFCGSAKPTRLWWVEAKNCTLEPGCEAWELRYEGFESFKSITATYTNNGGDCNAVSGSCSDTVTTSPDGRGTIVTWRFPASYSGTFAGRVGSLEAVIPD